jgi:hypothetical protein
MFVKCPICREDHYEALPEVCIDGKQYIRYSWKTNPKNCHSGVSLPAPGYVNCCMIFSQDILPNLASATSCPPGTKLTASDACVMCDIDEISLGNGELVSNWLDTLSSGKNSKILRIIFTLY